MRQCGRHQPGGGHPSSVVSLFGGDPLSSRATIVLLRRAVVQRWHLGGQTPFFEGGAAKAAELPPFRPDSSWRISPKKDLRRNHVSSRPRDIPRACVHAVMAQLAATPLYPSSVPSAFSVRSRRPTTCRTTLVVKAGFFSGRWVLSDKENSQRYELLGATSVELSVEHILSSS